MDTLKYSLEYHCYPIWIYDEAGNLIDNDLPDELRNDAELDTMLLTVQEMFDGLFTDKPQEFSSHEFNDETERQAFLTLLFSSVEHLRKKYGEVYHIVCKYTPDSFPIDPVQ